MSDSDSFIEEVNDELRQDRLYRIWRSFGPWVIGGVLGIAAAIMAGSYMEQSKLQAARTASTAFLEAAAAPAEERADRLEAYAADAPSGLAMLARMRRAGLLASQGESEAAKAAFDAIAEDGDLSQDWRDYAQLRALLLQYDAMESEAFIDAVSPFTLEDQPWRFIAAEHQAAAYLRLEQPALAVGALETLKDDPAAPDGFKALAEAVANALGDA